MSKQSHPRPILSYVLKAHEMLSSGSAKTVEQKEIERKIAAARLPSPPPTMGELNDLRRGQKKAKSTATHSWLLCCPSTALTRRPKSASQIATQWKSY